MDSQSKRREAQRLQEQWMRERAAQSARLETQNDYNNSKSTEQIIDRVTSHLMVKIKEEIKEEMKQDTGGQKYERFLAAEIESHTCPICYELMLAPINAPVLLHPCGHTFCKVCVSRHRTTHSKDRCPCCRESITAQAPNISLQQLIQNYIIKKKSSGDKFSDHRLEDDSTDENEQCQNYNGAAFADDKIHHIRRDLQMKEMRARVMETELISLQDQKIKNQTELDGTQSQFDQFSMQLQNLDEQVQKLQEQRQQTKQSQQDISSRLDGFIQERRELEERSVLISGVLMSLQEEMNLLKVVMEEHMSQAQN
eukprot:TRINITY_DN1341_c0_g1_i1.p1 TRINITY_DN1341_c0_g1~~TRINITY_DN1341_c0_g1_i1.p1  ORF type:complete len:311 (-),score=38.96 TRINITY_DN1341_c0_g1_i1:153-1085(-)